MNNKTSLSDTYANNVFLTEGKKALNKKANIVTKKMDIGNGKDKKLVGDGPSKAKLPTKVSGKKTRNMESYNTFEELFRSTLLENEDELSSSQNSPMDMNFEVPTTPEDSAEEIENTEDEVATLTSDLRDIMDKLKDILSKIEDESEDESEEEESEEEESEEEESEEEESEEEGDIEDEDHGIHQESVENHGTPLVNIRSGKDFNTKKKYVVNSKIKAKKGHAQVGKFNEAPSLKALGNSDADLRNVKKSNVKTSNVKAGDFFK